MLFPRRSSTEVPLERLPELLSFDRRLYRSVAKIETKQFIGENLLEGRDSSGHEYNHNETWNPNENNREPHSESKSEHQGDEI